MQNILKLIKSAITKIPIGAEVLAETWNSRYREIDDNKKV
jgi:hypothetical protein